VSQRSPLPGVSSSQRRSPHGGGACSARRGHRGFRPRTDCLPCYGQRRWSGKRPHRFPSRSERAFLPDAGRGPGPQPRRPPLLERGLPSQDLKDQKKEQDTKCLPEAPSQGNPETQGHTGALRSRKRLALSVRAGRERTFTRESLTARSRLLLLRTPPPPSATEIQLGLQLLHEPACKRSLAGRRNQGNASRATAACQRGGAVADHALGWGFEKPNQKALFEPGRGWGLKKCPFGGVAGVKRGKGGGEKGGGRKGEKKGRGEKGGKVDVFVFPGHFFGSPRVTLGTKTAPQNSTSASLPSLLLCTILQGGPKIFLGGRSPPNPPVGIPTKGGASPPQKPNQVQALPPGARRADAVD